MTSFLDYLGNEIIELVAHGIKRVNISLLLKNKFLALSIPPHTSKQLVITKGQCTLQSRSITWISVKTPRNLEINSLFDITLDRQLPKGLIPLDV